MTATEEATHCPRCRFPLFPRLGETIIGCLSCGWEDYDPPTDVESVPDPVKCPGAGRAMDYQWGGNQTRGRCRSCGVRLRATKMRRAPMHQVMSNQLCNGSTKGPERIVFREGGRKVQGKGCRGCALGVDDQRATQMFKHRIADSPKLRMYRNKILT